VGSLEKKSAKDKNFALLPQNIGKSSAVAIHGGVNAARDGLYSAGFRLSTVQSFAPFDFAKRRRVDGSHL
jgi:hypothetical protein